MLFRSDVNDIFMQLTGFGRATPLRHLWQAPFTLHRQILRAIQAETAHAEAGRAGRIIAKMNALVEPEVIGALYAASRAGVQIDLIVRGVCALRPGVAGASDWAAARVEIRARTETRNADTWILPGAVSCTRPVHPTRRLVSNKSSHALIASRGVSVHHIVSARCVSDGTGEGGRTPGPRGSGELDETTGDERSRPRRPAGR